MKNKYLLVLFFLILIGCTENNKKEFIDISSDYKSDLLNKYDRMIDHIIYPFYEEWIVIDGVGETVTEEKLIIYLNLFTSSNKVKLRIFKDFRELKDMTDYGNIIIGETFTGKNGEKYRLAELSEFRIKEGWANISMTDDHIIIGETFAEKKGEKSEFQFLDSWGNNAFGNIIFNDDGTITFYLDCNEYTDDGRMMGRLYGDTHILRGGGMFSPCF
jgi:hypothetical protein